MPFGGLKSVGGTRSPLDSPQSTVLAHLNNKGQQIKTKEAEQLGLKQADICNQLFTLILGFVHTGEYIIFPSCGKRLTMLQQPAFSEFPLICM